MTDLDYVREIVRRTRAEQGLPPTVTNALALDRIAAVFRLPPDAPASGAPPGTASRVREAPAA